MPEISRHMYEKGESFMTYLKNSGETDLATVNTATPGSPVNFDFVAAANENVEVVRITLVGEDNTRGGPDTFFGTTALTNGILFQILDDGATVTEHFATDDVPIKRHNQLGNHAGVDVEVDSTANTSVVYVRWTLLKSGKPWVMLPGWVFRVVVRDPLDGLVALRVMLQGVKATSYVFT